ncbi:hypothetical protein [Marinobacterium sp. BA1]|uniref:hypothetical protein n=1 Tax=Marinobacterium sp. BA1 TaxID=3138931 RepID=UPI0032E796B3
MNAAQRMAETQRLASKAHHENRLKWLKGKRPTWAGGVPVAQSDIHQMLVASTEALSLINDHGMPLNHCMCEPRCKA